MEERIEEGIIKESIDSITIKQTEEILNQMKNSICKIKGKATGTGFFCYINYEGKEIPCLMTNYHVLDNDFIKEKKMIEISMNDNEINEEISIKEKDIIYLSPNNEYDTIIIKLQKEENYINFLKLDDKLFNKNSEKGYESIYILHYPNASFASVSYGKGIKIINNYDIEHRCNTLSGSSGGPILNLTTNKVIGIHKGAINKNNNVKFNIGTLLKFPLNEIKNNINKNNIKNEINMEVNINVEDTNNKIYFLNNVSEINDSNTELYINNIKHEFKKYFEPTNQGIYSIKLKFNFYFKSCSGLFLGCKNLKSIDLSSFNTKDVINMSRMFENCIQLESVNFSSFNTRNVSNMIRMFYNCRNLKRIDLSSFDTKNVKYMNQMFYKCINLKTIDLTHFDLKNVCEMKSMFYFENVFNGGINVNKEAYEKIKELNSFITKFSCF